MWCSDMLWNNLQGKMEAEKTCQSALRCWRWAVHKANCDHVLFRFYKSNLLCNLVIPRWRWTAAAGRSVWWSRRPAPSTWTPAVWRGGEVWLRAATLCCPPPSCQAPPGASCCVYSPTLMSDSGMFKSNNKMCSYSHILDKEIHVFHETVSQARLSWNTVHLFTTSLCLYTVLVFLSGIDCRQRSGDLLLSGPLGQSVHEQT